MGMMCRNDGVTRIGRPFAKSISMTFSHIYVLSLGIPDLGMLIVKCLAVLGGTAVGAYGGGLFIKLAARFFRQKPPPKVVRLTRMMGGLALGLLVYAWVFGSGGEGGMGGAGGGWWPFGQKGGKGNVVAKPGETSTTTPEPSVTNTGVESLTVTMLGGERVLEQRFYLIGSDPPRNLPAVRDVISARTKQNANLKQLDIVIYKDSVDRDNPAVTVLVQWARDNGLTPRISFVDRNHGAAPDP